MKNRSPIAIAVDAVLAGLFVAVMASALVQETAYFGVYSFVQLYFAAYLLGRVRFAFADHSAPIALSLMSYASIAMPIGALFHY